MKNKEDNSKPKKISSEIDSPHVPNKKLDFYSSLKKFFIVHENISAALFFLVIISIFFFPIVFQGKTLTTSVNWGGTMGNGPYAYQGERAPFLTVRDPGAFAWADEPLDNYVGQVIKNERHFPIWNPNMGLGYPLLGGTQIGIFFPLNYIVFLFSSQLAWDVFILIKIFLAGFFTYLFARKIGLKKIPALVSGIIFMFNGYTIEYLNMSHYSSEALIPLVLFTVEYFLEKRNMKSFIFYVLSLSITILPGMPEATFFVFLISFLWLLFSLFFLHKEIEKKEKMKTLFLAVGINISSLLLSAIQLVPFLELLKNSFNTHSSGGAGSYYYPISMAFSFFSPFISNPVLNWVGETISYLGISSFVLSVLAILNLKSLTKVERKILLFFAIFAFLGLSKCFGASFINWIGNLPVFETLIFPKYGVPILMFSFSIIAGLGLTTLSRKEVSWVNLKIFSAMMFIIASFFYMLREKSGYLAQNIQNIDQNLAVTYLYLQNHIGIKIPSIFFEQDRTLLNLTYFALFFFLTLVIFLSFWIVITASLNKKRLLFIPVLIFVFVEYFLYSIPLIRSDRYDAFKKPPFVDFLKQQEARDGENYRIYAQSLKEVQPSVLYPNISSVFGLQDIRFLLALGEMRYFKFLDKGLKISLNEVNTIRFTGDYPISLENKYLDLMNVKYFIIPINYPSNDAHGKIVYDKEVKIVENNNYLPRVFIVHRAEKIFSQDEIFKYLDRNDFDFQKKIIVEKDLPSNLLSGNNAPESDNSIASIKNYQDNLVEIDAKMENDGFLVLLDQYYPGWEAYIDGKKTEIYPTDYVFRSIYLNKGEHKIEFIYDPLSYKIGKWLSVVTLFFLILLYFREKSRKNNSLDEFKKKD